MSYSVHLIDEKGQGSYLSVKNRTSWKTKRAAKRHLADIRQLIAKGKFGPVIAADLENEYGELILDRADRQLLKEARRLAKLHSVFIVDCH